MLQIINTVSGSCTKNLAAKAAATSSLKEAMNGNSSFFSGDTSVSHLSRRDLSFFSSRRGKEAISRAIKTHEDAQLASKYGQLIARRKRMQNLPAAWQVVDAIIYVDLFEAHYDGFRFAYEEVRDLFKGYRSQALREASATKGFNALVYRELAKALNDKSEMRYFMRAMNDEVSKASTLA